MATCYGLDFQAFEYAHPQAVSLKINNVRAHFKIRIKANETRSKKIPHKLNKYCSQAEWPEGVD